jgi:hypothetical protein
VFELYVSAPSFRNVTVPTAAVPSPSVVPLVVKAHPARAVELLYCTCVLLPPAVAVGVPHVTTPPDIPKYVPLPPTDVESNPAAELMTTPTAFNWENVVFPEDVRLVNEPAFGVVAPMLPGMAHVPPMSCELFKFATCVVLAITRGAVPVVTVDVNCPVAEIVEKAPVLTVTLPMGVF